MLRLFLWFGAKNENELKMNQIVHKVTDTFWPRKFGF